MFIVVPAKVETLMDRHPWSNYAIMATIILVSIAIFIGAVPEALIDLLVLDRGLTPGILGHVLIHGGIFHLAGNMVFLWVFGNAICANTTDRIYIGLFLGVTLGAALCHIIIDGNPAIGASGATNGIVGITLAMYPLNRVHMAGIFFIRPFSFGTRVWHLALIYFALDLFGVISSGVGIAYWAHLGGVITGLGLGLMGLKFRLLGVTSYDNKTLLEFLGGERSEVEEEEEEDEVLTEAVRPQAPTYTFTPPPETRPAVPVPPVPKK